MLDPGLEHLHRHGRLWRTTTQHAGLIQEIALDLAIIPPVVLLFLFGSAGEWASPLQVGVLVAACALASLVRFDIGSGSTSPLILAQVPLWYSAPAQWIPVLVALALGIGRVIEQRQSEHPLAAWRIILETSDAWPAVGAATVMAVVGAPQANADGFLIFVLAFAAQAVADVAVGLVSPWWIHGLKPSIQGRVMVWVVAVDAALAPIGFLAAIVMVEEPLAILGLLPLIAVLGEFARERRDRLDQAVHLSSAYRGTAQLIGDVLEADDEYTGGEHTRGVVDLAVAVGLELRLDARAMRDLEFGALLHDIGKLRVPNEIINKPSGLTDEEWQIVRRHPELGQEMLDRVGGALADAGLVVRAHHERWDGNGYPDGLKGEEIPITARIITVCDSFSAITTTRAYRQGRSATHAMQELRRCAGSQFDPSVVAAVERVLERAGDTSVPSAADDTLQGVARALGLRQAA